MKFKSDALVFMTAPQEVALYRGKKRDDYETEQMGNRISYMHFSYKYVNDKNRVECKPCGLCGARLYLEGCDPFPGPVAPVCAADASSSALGGVSLVSGGAPSGGGSASTTSGGCAPFPCPAAPQRSAIPMFGGCGPFAGPVAPVGSASSSSHGAGGLPHASGDAAAAGAISSSSPCGVGTPAKRPRLALEVVQALADAKTLKDAKCISSPEFHKLKDQLLRGE